MLLGGHLHSLVSLLAVFAAVACHGGVSSSPQPQVPSAVESPMGELDVSGEELNIFTPLPGPGLKRTTLTFRPQGSGTIVWTRTSIDGGTCARTDLKVMALLKILTVQGTLSRIIDFDEFQPIRIVADARIELDVTVLAQLECINARVALGIRFFADNSQMPVTQNSAVPGHAESSPVILPQSSSSGPCATVAEEPLAVAEIVFHGVLAHAEGCRDLRSWRIEPQLYRDERGCLLGRPSLDTPASTSDRSIKIVQAGIDGKLNLAWIQAPDTGAEVRGALERGESVHVIPAGDDCPDVSGVRLKSETPWSLIFFRGDARSECLGSGGIASSIATLGTESVRIAYEYLSPTASFWEARLSRGQVPLLSQHGPLQFRLFNRRVQGFITPWQPLQTDGDTAKLRIEDSTLLKRLLPYQKDLEILIADGDRVSCRSLIALPLYEWAESPEFVAIFQDLSRPGRGPADLTDPLE